MRKYRCGANFWTFEERFWHASNSFKRQKKVETDVGIAFMMMNLSKYWNRRWSKDQSSLRKNKNNKKKTVKQLKLRVGLIVFWYLKVSFFPDTHFKMILSLFYLTFIFSYELKRCFNCCHRLMLYAYGQLVRIF